MPIGSMIDISSPLLDGLIKRYSEEGFVFQGSDTERRIRAHAILRTQLMKRLQECQVNPTSVDMDELTNYMLKGYTMRIMPVEGSEEKIKIAICNG